MKRLILLVLFALTSMTFAAPPSGDTSQRGAKDDALREQGKKIFAHRGCAKCHDEDASKKLPDGTTLLQRLARSKDPEARLGTRLKDPQERRAVMLYIDGLLTRLQSPQAERSTSSANRR